MNLTELLLRVVAELKKRSVRFALAGGVVASVYRKELRGTQDIDFLLYSDANSEKTAEEILQKFGFKAGLARKANLEGGPMFAIKNQSTPVCIVVGRIPDKPEEIGLDFIMPAMPWFWDALERAENHQIKISNIKIPALTIEDIIIAKLYSVRKEHRLKDLDDLESIFAAKREMDLAYIVAQMKKHSLTLPSRLKKNSDVPVAILRIAKKIR